MAGDTPFKNSQGIPICPKCKIILPEGPEFCPDCRAPLRGPKLRRRTALGCVMMLVTLAGIVTVNRLAKQAPALPEQGEVHSAFTETLVMPHTTFYNILKPAKSGTLVFRVEAGSEPVGINAGPVGDDGFTQALDEKMRDTQTEVEAGQKGEVTLPVEAGRKCGIFIINETDKPARVKYATLHRWGR